MARGADDGWLSRLERHPLALSTLALLVALGAATGMAWVAGFSAVAARLEDIAPVWLAVAAGARLVSYLGYTVAHHRVMAACEHSDLEAETAARVVAFGAGPTSLRGGFSFDVRALRGSGASAGQARAHVAALALLEYAVLALAAWICALLLLGDPGVQGVAVWPWIIGVPAGVVFAALIWSPLRSRCKGRLRSVLRGAEILAHEWRRPLGAIAAVAGMALYWAAEAAAVWAALRAFGVSCDPAVAVLGVATAYVLTPRGLPLAGAGLAEVLLPISLKWLGIPLAAAVPAALAAELVRLCVSAPLTLLSRAEVQRLVGLEEAADGTRSGRRSAHAARP